MSLELFQMDAYNGYVQCIQIELLSNDILKRGKNSDKHALFWIQNNVLVTRAISFRNFVCVVVIPKCQLLIKVNIKC